ncbi:MAG: HD domain-containing protein [Candidatus Eremiobacteraeota bacterium]|nr:HD domain-containing protein [Candidatus Eremiobacteraeota bacterium]
MSGPLREIDRALAAVLPQDSLFAVGGRVRDEVRSALDGIERPAKDLDYVVVGVGLDDLIERVSKVGRADIVGAAFAVVKVSMGDGAVDVALPRRERSTGAGHRDFAVEAGPEVSLHDDLARRDFRMNMLARALPGGDLIDPYAGEADIRARRIDVLHGEAFVDDPLRMLRACQFAGRFAYTVAPPTLSAMQRAAALVATVSPERIRDELGKLLGLARRPSIGLEVMREGGLLQYVLPELAEGVDVLQNVFHAYDVYHHNLATVDAACEGDLTLRWAALLHDIGKPRTKSVDEGSALGAHFYGHETLGAEMSRALLERLRCAHEFIDDVAQLIAHHMYVADPRLEGKTIRRFVRRIGEPRLERQFALRAADIVGSGLPKRDDSNEQFEARVWDVVHARPPFSVADLAINGSDVVAALTRAGRLSTESRGGPEVGDLLRRLLESVLDDPSLNERAHLLALMEESIAALRFT